MTVTLAALAMYAGAAPLECSSGAWQRHRLSRVGNGQLNAALHRIAVTQLRVHPPAQAYLMRLQATGKSKREALAGPQAAPGPGGLQPAARRLRPGPTRPACRSRAGSPTSCLT